jgi:hypothetical protein
VGKKIILVKNIVPVSWGSASFTLPGIMKSALAARNTRFEVEEASQGAIVYILYIAFSRSIDHNAHILECCVACGSIFYQFPNP